MNDLDFQQALASNDPARLHACARALLAQGRAADACRCLDAGLELEPRNADLHNARGVALRSLRRLQAALASFDEALVLQPESPSALNNRALTLHDLQRSPEAALQLGKALALRPDYPAALNNLGMILHSIDRHAESAQQYARLLALMPNYPLAAGNLLRSRLACCDWSAYAQDRQRVQAQLSAGVTAADPLALLMLTDSPELQLLAARRFAAERFPAGAAALEVGARRHSRIRVAYLSADFHDHPVSHLLAGVLEHHDRASFETFGVSLRDEDRADPLHVRVRAAFEHFIDAADLADHDVAARLRDLEIDIAVDMAGLTRGGRLGILALRAAPIQVNFLGFAGTYGADYIDYLLADEVLVPHGDDRWYAERIVRLPHSFLPNDDAQAIAGEAPARAAAGLPETGFVFCAFSNGYKIVPEMFDVWMQLLADVPASVLWLRAGPGPMLSNLRREAAARGVAPERLVLAGRVNSMAQHLARYRAADLFLDTLPYGAHATARDALWAGLPVLTCAGRAFASRVAASLLRSLGLDELVTDSLPAYAARALTLARAPAALAALRRRLGDQHAGGPTFATDRYRRDLEAAYRIMWERAQRGEPAAGFSVPRSSGNR